MQNDERGHMENSFNKEFIDKGWKDMSAILDKEMPVKKNRRFLPFWIFLLVGLIAGGGLLYNYLSNPSTPEVRIENPDNTSNFGLDNENRHGENYLEKQDTDKENAEENLNLNQEQPVENEEALDVESTELTTSDLNRNVDQAPRTDRNDLNQNPNQEDLNNSSIKHTSESGLDDPSSKERSPMDRGASIPFENPSQKELNPIQNSGEIQIPINKSDDSALPGFDNDRAVASDKPIAGVYSNTNLNSSYSTSLIVHEDYMSMSLAGLTYPSIDPIPLSDSKWSSFAKVGGIVGIENMLGFELGVRQNFSLSRKVSLSADLGYRFLKQINLVKSDQNAVEAFFDTLDMTVTPGPEAVPLPRSLETMHFVDLQLNMNYHFNRKWNVFIGPDVAYAIGAGSTSESFDNAVASAGQGVFTNFSVDQSNKLSDLKRWDLGIQGGLGFSPGDRLNLSLYYRQGLTDLRGSSTSFRSGISRTSGIGIGAAIRLGR